MDIMISRFARLNSVVLLIVETGLDACILTTVKSGSSSIADRIRITLGSDAFTQALIALLEIHGEITNALIDRAIAVKSAADENFERVCRTVWRELPENIRHDLTEAETILISLSNMGDMNQVPVELFHDGREYLGLTKKVLRVTSPGQLYKILGENWINTNPYGKGLIVRAAEDPDFGHLPLADSEVQNAERSMYTYAEEVCLLHEPSAEELLTALRNGVDIMHYIGHGFADENGEMLILSSEEAISALNLQSTKPARAPVSILSSCFVGRARHLRTGKQRGITAALLEEGAGAVIAASYALPDQVGNQFVRTLYHHGRATRLSDAVLLTRRSLAARGYHPVAWGAFFLFGHPDATLVGLSKNTRTNLPWPVNLCRFIATGEPAYLDATRQHLYKDSRLSKEQVENVDAALDAFISADSKFFNPERLTQSNGLQAVDAEAFLASEVLLGIGYLHFGVAENSSAVQTWQRKLTNYLLTVQHVLSDSYVLVALVLALTKLSMLSLLSTQQERNLLRRALYALNRLNFDESFLQEAHREFKFLNERLENLIVVDAQKLAGVDAETWELADAGDRQSMKLILRNLSTREASIAALVSPLPWTEWMLRLIGCGTRQAFSDLLGVINESRKKGLLSKTEAEALNRLLEQYVGPGEVDEASAHAARDAFSEKPREHNVLDLFMIYDQITSQGREVPISEIQRAIRLAQDLGSVGAEAYYTSFWCERAVSLVEFASVKATAWDVLKKYEDLATQDSEFIEQMGLMALLLRQWCQSFNDEEEIARIDLRYMNAMQTYLSNSNEMDEFSR